MRFADRRLVGASTCALVVLLAAPVVAGAHGKKPKPVGQVTSFVATFCCVNIQGIALQPGNKVPLPLYAQNRIGVTGRGSIKFSLRTPRGTATCGSVPGFQKTQLVVGQSAAVLIHMVAGAMSCSSTARKAKKPLQFTLGKDGTAQALDPVVELVVRKGKGIVKVRRGVVVLAGSRGRAVVIGKNKQAAVAPGARAQQPARIQLTAGERKAFTQIEKGLPPVKDTTPPTTTITSAPTDPMQPGAAAFTFRAEGEKNNADVQFSCALDGADFRACSSPQTVAALPGGRHTFSVRATDFAGNVGLPVSYSWLIEQPASTPIVFESDRTGDYEIFKIDADGSGETRLTNAPSEEVDPSWSPDGTKIAFESTRDNGSSNIYVMNADGSNVTRLTTNPAEDRDPKWSPDGKQIAFDSNRTNHYQIYVLTLATGQVKQLTNDIATDVDPSWSPDGTKIAFESNLASKAGNIFVMNADGSGVTPLTSGFTTDSNPAWSPNGKQIVFESARDGNHEIYVMNADGSGQTRLTNNAARDSDPVWSPDGSRIAFASDRSGSLQVYVMNADGSNVTRVTSSAGNDLVPNW